MSGTMAERLRYGTNFEEWTVVNSLLGGRLELLFWYLLSSEAQVQVLLVS